MNRLTVSFVTVRWSVVIFRAAGIYLIAHQSISSFWIIFFFSNVDWLGHHSSFIFLLWQMNKTFENETKFGTTPWKTRKKAQNLWLETFLLIRNVFISNFQLHRLWLWSRSNLFKKKNTHTQPKAASHTSK